MTLYNNFLLKRGVGLFSRVGLISGDYGTILRTKHVRLIRDSFSDVVVSFISNN